MTEQERQELIEKVVAEAIKRMVDVFSARADCRELMGLQVDLVTELVDIPRAFGITNCIPEGAGHR
jgi:hypothetical protein